MAQMALVWECDSAYPLISFGMSGWGEAALSWS